MNPDSGRAESMPFGIDSQHEALREMENALRANVEAMAEAAKEADPEHPLCMTLKQRWETLQGDRKPPVFSRGEFIVLRGVAFRVSKIIDKGIILKIVKDTKLVEMVQATLGKGGD